MIDEFIDYLKRIKEQLAGESCLKGEPFMKLGKATVLDQYVNVPGYVSDDFGKALNNFYIQNPTVSKKPSEWLNNHIIYEAEIIEYYGVNRRGTNMKKRFNNIKNYFSK
jgi:hypothetical protein